MLMLLARRDIHRYTSCFMLQTTECLCLLGCDVDAVSETRHTPLQIMFYLTDNRMFVSTRL